MSGARQGCSPSSTRVRMQLSAVSRNAMMSWNARVQNLGMSTMLQVSGMVSVRRQLDMEWTDEDYARVGRLLARQKTWEALAAATMGMLAAYEAIVGGNGDPKALDAIAASTLKVFPLKVEVTAEDAKSYVANLAVDAVAQKGQIRGHDLRATYGDAVYEAQYKRGIDAMFDRAQSASSTPSMSQRLASAGGQARLPAGLRLPGAVAGGASVAGKGLGVAEAMGKGDAPGVLQGAADLVPGDGPIQSSLQGVAALSKGDYKGALKAAIGLARPRGPEEEAPSRRASGPPASCSGSSASSLHHRHQRRRHVARRRRHLGARGPRAPLIFAPPPVPLPAAMMKAPAWPMRLPGGAVAPAMKAATGFFIFSWMNLATRSSAPPPISPMRMTPCVSGSAWKSSSTSTKSMPPTGSPPMPMHVD